jgi:tetrahydromethanopterin:alpha-L-glutamate ligase
VCAQRIAIVTDNPGWHGERLSNAFAARGIESTFVSLKSCGFDFSGREARLCIPGFEERLPDGVFVRGVPGGSLEQVVARLDILHALAALGIPVCNDGRAIERTVDKAMTSFLLSRARIATAATWVVESIEAARDIVLSETAGGRELVLKPVFGSQGMGLKRVAGVDDLVGPEQGNGVFYLQRFVPPGEAGYRDWRVFVIGRKTMAAMCRHGTSWINNVAQGARCEAADLDDELCAAAEEACEAVDVAYAGVDLMREPDGRLLVIEVNGIPAWRGLQSVTALDIAQALADHFITTHLARPALQSVA